MTYEPGDRVTICFSFPDVTVSKDDDQLYIDFVSRRWRGTVLGPGPHPRVNYWIMFDDDDSDDSGRSGERRAIGTRFMEPVPALEQLANAAQ